MSSDTQQHINAAAITAHNPQIKITIGASTYIIGIHFAENKGETLATKINRMVCRDICSESFSY